VTSLEAPVTSLQRIQMPAAYAAGATGENRVVAILDTGGRRSHKFLNTRIVSAACFGTNDAEQGSTSYCPGGVASSLDIDSANDCNPALVAGCGHGTHVAGTAAGFNSSPLAGEPLHGVARDARIISINVFSRFTVAACNQIGAEPMPQGCILSFTSDQMLGLDRVYNLRNTYNIDAVNMSLGGGQFFAHCDTEPLKLAIDTLRTVGIATVIAAGNEGFDNSVSSPGCISTAVTVASSTKSDARSDFSNWGSMIDVVAPGSFINASYISNDQNVFEELSGTSMASPHVAGVFAALRSARPAATLDQIEAALKNTGTAIANAGTTKPRVNVNSTLTALPGGAVKAVMSSPTPGSVITTNSATFNWTAGTGVTNYWLYVGTNGAGSANILSQGGAQTSRTVTGLPVSGTLNVRLMSYIAGGWQFNDYTYTMNGGAKAVMSSPTPGSTLTTTSATFNWTAGSGVASYWLMVGTNGAGSANILSQGGAQTSRTVTGLPASGTLNVRLMSYIGSAWQFNDYTYTMNAATKAVMSSPTPGSTLTTTSATFNWTTGSGASSYWLYVGSNGAGSANILSQGGAQTSRTVTGLPSSGTLNVRLMSYIGSAWQFNDYTYTMNAPVKAVMSTPAPGSTLENTTTMFQWTASPGTAGYWLMVGTTGAGSANLFSSAVTNTWRAVAGLPRVGTVNVRLMTYVGGGWQSNDYTYTMAVPAMMTSPTPGSTLQGSAIAFHWDGHASIANYWLHVGTQGPGSSDILSEGVSDNWRIVYGLPTSGTINVRLMSWVGGAWRFRDYTYTGSEGAPLEVTGGDVFSSLVQPISLD